MKKLVLVRGIPGSGKSTLSEYIKDTIKSTVHHFEADMYWVRPDGRYDFVGHNLRHAHAWCQKCVELVIHDLVPDYTEVIVVSNTFTTLWEMQVYLSMIEDNKDVLIVECVGQWGSIHNVPEDAIERMRGRLEKTVDYIDSVVYDGSNADEVIRKIKGE